MTDRGVDDWDRIRRQVAKAKRERLRRLVGYEQLVTEVSALLYEADPAAINFEENTDEYDPEAQRIVVLLLDGVTEALLPSAIHDVFITCFDPSTAGPTQKYRQVSARIWEAWRAHSGRE